MKVLLIKDVYKLGHAGDVKKVADGYGRNYLIPQGLAVIATPGALKQADYIRKEAARERAVLNQEMSGFAEQLQDLMLTFPARASETGKLYGSVTTRMIAETLSEQTEVEINHHQVDTQPLRTLGEHSVAIRLTVDLIPEIKVIVYREGESPESVLAPPEDEAEGAEAMTTEGEAPLEEQGTLAESQATAGDAEVPEEGSLETTGEEDSPAEDLGDLGEVEADSPPEALDEMEAEAEGPAEDLADSEMEAETPADEPVEPEAGLEMPEETEA